MRNSNSGSCHKHVFFNMQIRSFFHPPYFSFFYCSAFPFMYPFLTYVYIYAHTCAQRLRVFYDRFMKLEKNHEREPAFVNNYDMSSPVVHFPPYNAFFLPLSGYKSVRACVRVHTRIKMPNVHSKFEIVKCMTWTGAGNTLDIDWVASTGYTAVLKRRLLSINRMVRAGFLLPEYMDYLKQKQQK